MLIPCDNCHTIDSHDGKNMPFDFVTQMRTIHDTNHHCEGRFMPSEIGVFDT